MVRTGCIPALAAVAWLTGVACCAAEAKRPEPSSPSLPQQEAAFDQPAPEPWPAGSLESNCRQAWCGCTGPLIPGLPIPGIPIWIPDLSLAPPATRTFGPGHPIPGTSWRNRPWYVGGFFGPMFGDDLIDGSVEQDVGVAGGARFGYDLDYYWGVETSATYVVAAIDDGRTAPAGNVNTWYFDGAVVLYPWGDSQWRPFYAVGAGAGHFRFEDADGVQYRETLFQVPLSVGVKYLYERWFAFRAELTHHVVFGAAGLDTMDNFSAAAGFEIHFGAQPRSYFPW